MGMFFFCLCTTIRLTSVVFVVTTDKRNGKICETANFCVTYTSKPNCAAVYLPFSLPIRGTIAFEIAFRITHVHVIWIEPVVTVKEVIALKSALIIACPIETKHNISLFFMTENMSTNT